MCQAPFSKKKGRAARWLGAVAVLLISGGWALDGWAAAASWDVKNSDHFLIYYQEASPAYLDGLIAKAESYYNDLTETLGFTRFEGFWTWDDRAKIYLYPTREAYQQATHQPGWSEGGANVRGREIYTHVNMPNFFETILPHELGHVIFREFVGFQQPLPLWLDEGIACFLEGSTKPARLRTAKALLSTPRFLSLEALSKIGPGGVSDPEVFYSEAASLIEFLFRQYGQEKFVDYCRHLRDKGDWVEGLIHIYGFRDLSEMGERWVEFLRN